MIILNKKNDLFIGAVYTDNENNKWSITSIFNQYVNLRNMDNGLIWFEQRFKKITIDELKSDKYTLMDELDVNYVPFRVGDRIMLEDDVPGFPNLTKGKTIYICDYISCGDMPLYVHELDEFGNLLTYMYNLPLNAIQEIVDLVQFDNFPMYFDEETNRWEYNDAPTLDEYYLD